MSSLGLHFWIPHSDEIYLCDFVPLAEGLQALGVEFTSNRRYWSTSVGGPYLFDRIVENPKCDESVLHIFSHRSYRYFDRMGRPHASRPEDEFPVFRRLQRRILIDMDDGYLTDGMRNHSDYEMVLRAHWNDRCEMPQNARPWALGISNRMTQMAGLAAPFTSRRNVIGVNFGASHGYEHSARAAIGEVLRKSVGGIIEFDSTKDDLRAEPLDPWDRLMWKQCQGLHSREYYRRIGSMKMVSCFCGEIVPGMPRKPTYLVGGNRARMVRVLYDYASWLSGVPVRIIQFDSWRFWEVLLLGCVAINCHLDQLGGRLPVQPEPWVHYVPVYGGRADLDLAERLADQDDMERIASQGREWAMAHYSPVAVARRFLELIGK